MTDRDKSYDPGIYAALGEKSRAGDMNAFEAIKQGAAQGHGYAQLELGFNYAKGSCVKQDNRLAAQWYEKAAAQGVLNAQFNLGCLHYLGQGCKRSVVDALHWFKMAADGGHERAKQNLIPMQMEAELTAEEHAIWAARGINKAPGIVKYDLAHGYLAELKALAADPEVRQGLRAAATDGRYGLAKAAEIGQALTLVYNVSSSTPLAVEKVLYCAANNDWQAFETMPAQ